MSAYIVGDRTINRVVCYLNSTVKREYSWLFERILNAAGIEPTDEEWTTKLGVSMALLNDKAMDCRYGQGTASGDRQGESFEFHWEDGTSIQVFKSLECWRYQCSEGDIPETSELYKALDKLAAYISAQIVSRLPAYEKAGWA